MQLCGVVGLQTEVGQQHKQSRALSAGQRGAPAFMSNSAPTCSCTAEGATAASSGAAWLVKSSQSYDVQSLLM